MHKRLGRLAAPRGVDRVGVDAEALGQDPAGIGVAPREDADDPDRVEAGQHPGDAGVGLGQPCRRLEEGDRFEGLGPLVDALGELADADQHRGTRIEGHRNGKLDGGVQSVESRHRK